MGTACELLRLRDDGLVDRIKVSLDGFPRGAGVMLFRHYRTEDAVERLFGYGDHAVSLAPNPLEMEWDESDERSPVTPAELLRRSESSADPTMLHSGASRDEGKDGRDSLESSPARLRAPRGASRPR